MKRKEEESSSLKTKLKHLCIGGLFLFAPFATPIINAQTPGIVIKDVRFQHEDLMRPMHDMMSRIYTIKMSGDMDKDYAAIMNEFHQGGISLCKVYSMSGEDPKLLESAKVNAVELKEDHKLLKACCLDHARTADSKTGSGELMSTLNYMMKRMEQKGSSGNLNDDYVSIMATYDWAEREMAKTELRYGQNTALKNRSADIIEESSCRENTLLGWSDKSVAEK